ncbi:hypothetical protein A2V61_01500 [Candidatus Woesebacteria bacterium RBG_19FT_COMBO_47_8]|uniref:Uncharacterized protein n=1 Tax=Candidatus Woesebacteria bacterium RBG_13_46_13 TaxID=1802479 RepID=A0A1F7X3H3_9BACT|nr:MAG: hypothetical protein A2Y68_03285 [Candidatus Woesebacteria bacterium RBG_13_46_13]OGM17200.1 MAG: hypothetical protein A2V61_01500 [Candidatus Woesebacteria bacterium RBG_19FT_COMBO_47_8]HJX59585.1 hypothetical protein [Patescibacteria group bacterium]
MTAAEALIALRIDAVRLLSEFPSDETNHVSRLYEIKPATEQTPLFTCAHCEKKARFLTDHKGDQGIHTLYATCEEHSIPAFGFYLDSANSA